MPNKSKQIMYALKNTLRRQCNWISKALQLDWIYGKFLSYMRNSHNTKHTAAGLLVSVLKSEEHRSVHSLENRNRDVFHVIASLCSVQHLKKSFFIFHLAHLEKNSAMFCCIQIKTITKITLFLHILHHVSTGQSYLTSVQKQNILTNTCFLW